ncbi:MAG: hypothetical protein DRH57_05370 [Candidatus Cloacimonadota bacterium]|nr:MAG: hypothetical protein DRH57_05370 [Candidatus Cloacimonadota bacterium]
MNKFVHGSIIEDLLNKTKEGKIRLYLNEINIQYKKWNRGNLAIKNNSKDDIKQKVDLYNEYYKTIFNEKYIRKNKHNRDGFSMNHPIFKTVLTEFCYYVFKDITFIKNGSLILGYRNPLVKISIEYNQVIGIGQEKILHFIYTDENLLIGTNYELQYKAEENMVWCKEKIFVPVVIIAPYQVLTNNILSQSIVVTKEIKNLFPNCLYIIVCETSNNDFKPNLNFASIDNIFVLRKQVGDIATNPVYTDIVWKMYQVVSDFLTCEKENYKSMITKGILK